MINLYNYQLVRLSIVLIKDTYSHNNKIVSFWDMISDLYNTDTDMKQLIYDTVRVYHNDDVCRTYNEQSRQQRMFEMLTHTYTRDFVEQYKNLIHCINTVRRELANGKEV